MRPLPAVDQISSCDPVLPCKGKYSTVQYSSAIRYPVKRCVPLPESWENEANLYEEKDGEKKATKKKKKGKKEKKKKGKKSKKDKCVFFWAAFSSSILLTFGLKIRF